MRRIAALSVIALMAFGLAACGGETDKTQKKEIDQIHQQLKILEHAEPMPLLKDSGNRRNQAYYYTAEADPNKTWFLTLVGLDGTPYAQYTIKGPVSSTNDEVTNPQELTCRKISVSNGDDKWPCGAVSLAEPDGTYSGDHGPEFVAILATGAVLKFSGNYVVSDQPNKIKTPVKFSIDESVAPSDTDLSRSSGGKVPEKR